MKTKHRAQYVIPTVVVCCSVILLAALTVAIAGFSWSQSDRTLVIHFSNATGVKLHSEVRYAGATAGVVTGIRYLTAEERALHPEMRIRVLAMIYDDVPPIPSDIAAGISSESFLSEKFVALTGGSNDTEPLPANGVLNAQPAASLEALAESTHKAIKNAGSILEKLNNDYPQIIPRVTGLLDTGTNLLGSANSAVVDARKLFGQLNDESVGLAPRLFTVLSQSSNILNSVNLSATNIHRLTVELNKDYAELLPRLTVILDEGKTVATNATATLNKGKQLLGNVDGVVQGNADELTKILAELRVVSQNLKVISTYAKALTATVGEKPSRMIWGRKTTALPSEAEILKSSEPVTIQRPDRKRE